MSAILRVFALLTFLNISCITNMDTLFLTQGFICLVDKIKFMQISIHLVKDMFNTEDYNFTSLVIVLEIYFIAFSFF